MDELTAFLKARLEEDEAGAWAVHDVARCDALLYEEDMAGAARRDPDCDCGMPARALRAVEAKRNMLNTIAALALTSESFAACLSYEMAAEWADHPDYRAEWKPDA